jgi:hypothetical protein
MDTKQDMRLLYPRLSKEELLQAEDNLDQYLLLLLRIYERIKADPESYARFRALTGKSSTLPCTPPRSGSLPDIQIQ